MRLDKYIETTSWIAIIGGAILAGFGLYKFGFAENSNYAILMLVLGLVVLAIGIVLFILNERKKRKKKQTKKQKSTKTQESVNYSIRYQLDDEKIEKKGKLIATKIDYSVVGEVCMISKLPIEESESVLQCPFCSSYFLKEYLEEWTEENDICPVCKKKIIDE